MKTFWNWILSEGGRRTGAKLSLYPMGYGDIGVYPPGEYITHSADAIYYMSREERKYYGQSGPPYNVLHLKVDYPENKVPKYKIPDDTSTQFNLGMPPDTSLQFKHYIPPHLSTNGTDPERFTDADHMPSDDPTNTLKATLPAGTNTSRTPD